MTTQSRMTELINLAATEDCDAETWSKRLTEWRELTSQIEYEQSLQYFVDTIEKAFKGGGR